ncbi:protein phosphatase PHLPP-like protein [Toxorhynchites rutilus septentrionalis]|uniref:protein phosphatase PHLPP-like protein n=1 Tax=Toxorhynchites rutilus septentrionalis TaxID=329112 RepID=UPI002478F8DB|nr:protein phosphatase PHLPP-like protein [Toxorhynchites rutilus septentrionalis]XP_055636066.1 protein phosphatase PHLPP-like protein [Toxorhynchites rutilus septentrionalis]
MEIVSFNAARQDLLMSCGGTKPKQQMHTNGTLRSIKQRRNAKLLLGQQQVQQPDQLNIPNRVVVSAEINYKKSACLDESDSNNNNSNNYSNGSVKCNGSVIRLDGSGASKSGSVSSGSVCRGRPVNLTLSKMSLLWNTSGWIRVYCGPDRSDVSCEDPSRMVHVSTTATTLDVVKDMDLPMDYTLWIQIGGSKTRRLEENEYPLLVQEEFLKTLGYLEESRRARLGIDPELKHMFRFHIGPSENPMCRGILRSGWVEILKGLVFPQWRKRYLAIAGSSLIMFPASSGMSPEIYELSGADIFEHTPSYNRLIIKIVPKSTASNTKETLNRFIDNADSATHLYNSNASVHSINERETVLFLGFEESWERDQWSGWLSETKSDSSDARRLDLGDSGLHQIPEIFLQSSSQVEELLAGKNKLQELALRALGEFAQLKVLRLNGNGLRYFPESLYNLRKLRLLDLEENEMRKLPEQIAQLTSLEELILEKNELQELPNSLQQLPCLKSLNVAYNHLEKLPSFMVNNMASVGFFQRNGSFRSSYRKDSLEKDEPKVEPPLTKVNLRGNQLKGSIILGNYGLLTQLDVSENSIEVMDLSALDKLETIQCCRNNLKELTLNGRMLHSLIAGNNNLTKITVRATPINLKHIDISFNSLRELPDWLVGCHQLRTLYANNNQIHVISEHLLNNEHATILTLHLAYNNLSSFPPMVKRKLPLQKLYLQCNLIEDLPENFFIACERLTILNVSSNKLMTLPIIFGTNCNLEKLYATNNSLTDRVLDSLICLTRLRVLHIGYNLLTTLPETCITCWGELEELVISGNKLRHLPDNLTNLRNLRVLRVHSNQLQTVPALARNVSLRVLDLAHNQLDKINMVSLVSKQLQFLDLSSNSQLQVDPRQLQACQSQRPMSFVDVSGKNRPTLPTSPWMYKESDEYEPCWKVGFAETTGCLPKLYISQLRLPGFCNTEGLFGMFDGEVSNAIPNLLVKTIPKILLEERTVKETAIDYMKYTLLSAHRELKQQGQHEAVNVTLCHISRSRIPSEVMSYLPQSTNGRKFILRVASVGESSAVLIKHNRCVKLTTGNPNRRIGLSANFPVTVPDPEVHEVVLTDADEYLVIGNKKMWEVITMETVAEEIRKEDNILLAAKRVQDIAQSYGAEENISIIIVKFNNLGTDIDFLMRELRQTIRKKPTGGSSVMSGFCKCGCCCESNNSCCHSGASSTFIRHPSGRSDRSSPSGQSDQTSVSDIHSNGVRSRCFEVTTVNAKKPNTYLTNERRSLRGGVVRAVRARIEEEKEREIEESDSAMSEEQFKCWEYMLEQNTQLLFDKELNTISRGFTKRPQSNLTRPQMRSLSLSSPQLALDSDSGLNSSHSGGYNAMQTTLRTAPFLSKHFGSTRSFHPSSSSQSFFKPIRYNAARPQPINTGPNAAYFGSLQRLMPYNLEYDLNAVHERYGGGLGGHGEGSAIELDTVDPDGGRMQQYWGVATTEL